MGNTLENINHSLALLGHGDNCPPRVDMDRTEVQWCADRGGKCKAGYVEAVIYYGADSFAEYPNVFEKTLQPNEEIGCTDADFGCDPGILSSGDISCWS